ncbi:MAG: hypothetical protein IKE32_03485 [Aeriscardovia sp.]|nr:hypothetical protein [Aeriscardovia sp.]
MKTEIENLRSISEQLMAALPACCSTAFKRSMAAASVGSWQNMGVACVAESFFSGAWWAPLSTSRSYRSSMAFMTTTSATGLSFAGRVLPHHRSLPENTFHGRSPSTDVLAGIASGRG